MDKKKVFVLGIDGAMPEKIFEEWSDELPNIKKLMGKGCYARLNSTIPPLSGVAWTSIVTGKKPAEHGIFEYVYRKGYSYDEIHIICSEEINGRTVWQIVSENNKNSISCLVPFTWPIKPFKGICICGFGLPKTKRDFAWPKEMESEINNLFKDRFAIVTKKFRDVPKEKIIKSAYKITDMHFKLMKYLLKNKEWDLFFGVLMESDVINHNFLKFADKKHRKYEPASKFKDVMKNFYKYVDKKLGELLKLLDKDTTIIVLSDHGMSRMHNRVNLSDWLIKEGYLVLKEPVKERIKLETDMIDWERTKAWAIGAYEGQIYINLKGREPKGIVSPGGYDLLVEELGEKLRKIKGDDGKILKTKIYTKKKDFQGNHSDFAPDIMVYFDDLEYGANTSLIGNSSLWSPQTAVGSDDAGHSKQGIFVMNKPKQKGNIDKIDILDVAPTILNALDIPIPDDMHGKVIE